LGRFSERWRGQYPKAVCLVIEDEEELLSFFKIKERSFWPKIRTTKATKRRFREVRRRTRPMGVFSDRTSMERALPPYSHTKT
jgi:transposase-like protein